MASGSHDLMQAVEDKCSKIILPSGPLETTILKGLKPTKEDLPGLIEAFILEDDKSMKENLGAYISDIYVHEYFRDFSEADSIAAYDSSFLQRYIDSIICNKNRRLSDFLHLGKLEDRECDKISNAVDDLMKMVCKKITESDANFEVTPVQVGSSSCGIKCIMPNEFDYFFLLNKISKAVLYPTVEAITPGYVKVKMKDSMNKSLQSYMSEDGYLQVFKLRNAFIELLCKCMAEVYMEPNLLLQPVRHKTIFEWNKVCVTFKLIYLGSNGALHKNLHITVDISPALEIYSTLLGDNHDKEPCYVIPKLADDPETEKTERELTWTVSTSIQERDQIIALPQKCKDVMIILKTMRDLYRADSDVVTPDWLKFLAELDHSKQEVMKEMFINFAHVKKMETVFIDSYTLKTAFLHEYDAHQNVNEWDNVEERVLNMLGYISESCKNSFMSHHYLKGVNILSSLKKKDLDFFPCLYLMKKSADVLRGQILNEVLLTKIPLLSFTLQDFEEIGKEDAWEEYKRMKGHSSVIETMHPHIRNCIVHIDLPSRALGAQGGLSQQARTPSSPKTSYSCVLI